MEILIENVTPARWGIHRDLDRRPVTKPITPDDVVLKKIETIPDYVIEGFNKAIAEKWNGRSSTVLQKDVLKIIYGLMPEGTSKHDLFRRGWTDVEPIFQAAGWIVSYDKPAYNESYDAYFVFSKGVR